VDPPHGLPARGAHALDLPDAPLPSGDAPAPPRFVPDYDNLVLSHAERGRVISDEHRKRVFLSAARVRATFLIDALLPEARSQGYDRAQLWTQSDNARARRLYEGRGFVPSGWEKDEFGERIVHYQRALPETD
jgi:GNAT superfamily N-acetyltransferase